MSVFGLVNNQQAKGRSELKRRQERRSHFAAGMLATDAPSKLLAVPKTA